MPVLFPSTEEALASVVAYLEHELLPTLDGFHLFQVRVTVNLLKILAREARDRSSSQLAETRRLSTLLGKSAGEPVEDRELAEAIREGKLDLDDPKVTEHIRATLIEALAINSPKWLL